MRKLYLFIYLFSCLPIFPNNPPPNNSIALSLGGASAAHHSPFSIEYITPKNLGQLKKEKLTRDSSAHYLGSGIYSNIRYQCKVKSQLEWGFNLEKDAGEKIEFNAQSPLGYDYHSFYLSLKEIGKIRTIQMGDFQANFGQGLTLSTGLSFGKSGIITSTKRNFNGFKPYKSLRENAFLRGIAFAFQKHNFTIGTFLSQKTTMATSHYFWTLFLINNKNLHQIFQKMVVIIEQSLNSCIKIVSVIFKQEATYNMMQKI